MRKNLKGFTLVELLVAMAIIGIILGLALFGIAAAQRNARDTARKAALQDINAGAADLFTQSGRPLSSVYFSQSDSAALLRSGTDSSTTVSNCNPASGANFNCVVVPMEEGSVPNANGAPSGAFNSNTDTSPDFTRYYFGVASDGYHLGACLENETFFDASTAGSAPNIGNACIVN